VVIILFKFVILTNLSKDRTASAPGPKYYQDLKTQCNLQPGNLKNCCLSSAETMEIVGGVLFPQENTDGCRDNYERMTLRCPGSLTWCQTDPNNGIDNTAMPPVPQGIPQIVPADHPMTICTEEAKLCPDGSSVGRTVPECKFTACPEESLTPDFISTENIPIKLPDNVISKKDCTT